MKQVLFIFLLISFSIGASAQEKFTLNGTVKDISNGEELIGATIFIKELETGTVTNVYGYFSISLPAGDYTVVGRYIGYENAEIEINLDNDIRRDFELKVESTNLEVVEIIAEKQDKNVDEVQMSVERLSAKEIKSIPAFMGEVDLIKAIQLLPGVQTIGEGTSGMYVSCLLYTSDAAPTKA